MIISFSDLWEKCENLHSNKADEYSSALDELKIKINIYESLSKNMNENNEELLKIKSRTLGEILFSITKLSLIDNVNVFQALADAYKFHSIENYISTYDTK